MREISPDLQAHLDSGTTTLASCWRIIRRDGEVLGFTEHDRDLAFDGTVFKARSGGSLSALSASADLSVDNATIEGALSDDAITEIDLKTGRYDGAEIEIWRVNWQQPADRLLLKVGTLGEVSFGPLGYSVEFRGISHKLDHVTGRIYQYTCDAVLGDEQCGVDLDDPMLRGTGTVQVVHSTHEFTASGLESFSSGWFARGFVTFDDGLLAGLSYPVKSHGLTGGETDITLWQPLPAPLSGGETITIIAGCDKQFATCRNKFLNGENFRGFPHMPGNDFVMAYPVRGEKNDGGRR